MAGANHSVLRLGAARERITPRSPVQVCPFRSLPERNGRLMEGVAGDLFCSALYMERGGWDVLLLSADLLWLPGEACARVAACVAEACGVPAERCLIATTHTHSSPQTLDGAPFYGDAEPEYVEWAVRRMVRAACRACETAVEGRARYREHRLADPPFAGRNVFVRDRLAGGVRCLRAARPGTPNDPVVRSLVCTDLDGAPMAVVLGLAAHPVFNFRNKISPDYPGELRGLVCRRLGADVPVLFLQGFDGDVRPAYYRNAPLERLYRLLRFGSGARLFRGDLSGLEADFAARVAAELDFAAPCVEPPEPCAPQCRAVELAPHGEGPGPDDRLRLVRLDLPGGPSLLAANAEIFSAYAPLACEAGRGAGLSVLPVGCAGGMFGYVPDAEMFGHGVGYELESWRNFGRPGPLPPGFASEFAAALRSLFEPGGAEEAT